MMMSRAKLSSSLVLMVLVLSTLWVSAAKDVKLKPEELVERHLASIGTSEARQAVKSRALSGPTEAVFRIGGQGLVKGTANVLSEGRQTRFGMNYSLLDYPGEQFGFNGTRVTVGDVRPGQRSPLSAFVYHYDVMMKEGLLGGVLTAAWPLLDLAGRQPKLESTGLRKIEGRQLHELKYRARRGPGDLQIALYFEPETYRHVLTNYRLVQPAQMVSSPTESPGQRDSLYTLVEFFGDFQQVDGLTLPHAYRLIFTIEGQNSTYLAEWKITATKVVHNVPIDAKYFSVQ